MSWVLGRFWVPLAVSSLAGLLASGCAVGDSGGGLTGFGSNGAMTQGASASATATAESGDTGDGDTGVMSGNASGDSGPDDGGPDPDGGSGTGCVPEDEICNGLDDDCDGVPDDGEPGAGEACDTGMPGVCAEGLTACEGGAIACNPVGTSAPELCDGLDNDCSGQIDDGDPGGGGNCDTGMPGVCGPGIEACEGGAIVCVATVAPSAEACNGLDDDCDGVADDGNPNGGGACNTGQPGVCGPGTLACTGGAVMCQSNVGAAPVETCGNGLDDNCNGVLDDGCGCSFGLCQTPGIPQVDGCDPCVTQVCAADSYCCTTAWDAQCVDEVGTICGSAECVGPPLCAHSACTTGAALDSLCHSCVNLICSLDSYCCTVAWDAQCVSEVGLYCGLTC